MVAKNNVSLLPIEYSVLSDAKLTMFAKLFKTTAVLTGFYGSYICGQYRVYQENMKRLRMLSYHSNIKDMSQNHGKLIPRCYRPNDAFAFVIGYPPEWYEKVADNVSMMMTGHLRSWSIGRVRRWGAYLDTLSNEDAEKKFNVLLRDGMLAGEVQPPSHVFSM